MFAPIMAGLHGLRFANRDLALPLCDIVDFSGFRGRRLVRSDISWSRSA
jgi:hypothetical protein